MCGFVGYISGTDFKKNCIREATNAIAHRGPDNQGFFDYNSNDYCLSFGHTRLSIIDLHEESNQPFISQCGNFVLVFFWGNI